CRMDSADLPLPRSGEVLDLRLLAQRVRRPGLRVRVLGGAPRCAGGLGGPVRRLRQRRPGGDRRVHLLGAPEVGTDLLGGAAAAALLRGTGPGPLLGTQVTVAAALG